MDVSGGNALNRSTQSLWAMNSRKKVNLNSVATPSPSGPSSKVQTPVTEEPPPTEPAPESTPNASVKRKSARTTGSEPSKRARVAPKEHTPPTTRLADLGGVDVAVNSMLELIAMPLRHSEIYMHLGVPPPRGVLLHGPPGCGKTLLANAIAGELGVPFLNISAPSIVSGMSGESEKTLRDTFEEAKKVAPCLLFIDEIDAITPKRENAQREMERRIVAQFLTCMDELAWEKNDFKPVIVIGATNRPDSLDAALRRAGRFDHEIGMGVPDQDARAQILRVLSAKLRLEGDFDFDALAKQTPGYVGADLSALTSAAGTIAVKRTFKQLVDGTLVLPPSEVDESLSSELTPAVTASVEQQEDTLMVIDPPLPTLPVPATPASTSSLPFSSSYFQSSSSPIAQFLFNYPQALTSSQLSALCITAADFSLALKQVQPSSKREGFATVPDVTWTDIGALDTTRQELQAAIVQPIRRPEMFKAVGIEAPCGVLLWGPPGCGKTLLAKAVANESGANFISVKGPELLNKYVGESERAVRQVFQRARASAPCVIFFDELDALVPRRDDSLSESSARVVNTLLLELDGLEARKSVHVIGATNRPDMIDPALLRPRRFDKKLYVDLPDAVERTSIVRTITRGLPLGPAQVDVSLSKEQAYAMVQGALEALVRERCERYSGADLAALVREAGVIALTRALGTIDNQSMNISTAPTVWVSLDDFEQALLKVGPSVSIAQRKKYLALKPEFSGGSRVKIGGQKETDGDDTKIKDSVV